MSRIARPIRTIAGALASVALVFAVGACSDSSIPTAQSPAGAALAQGNGGSEKFTFEGVTLTDGELVVEDAVVEVAVRDHKQDKNDWTNCSYFTEAWGEHLGAYNEDVVAGDGGADAARTFCVANFPNRQ